MRRLVVIMGLVVAFAGYAYPQYFYGDPEPIPVGPDGLPILERSVAPGPAPSLPSFYEMEVLSALQQIDTDMLLAPLMQPPAINSHRGRWYYP